MTSENTSTPLSELVANATGPLLYNLTNDYLFRALLQKNNEVLKGLICSLLHLEPEEIISADITNPIILGESVQDKVFILDVHVNLNNNILIDLEMQVVNYDNWPDRSLGYLCRTFDNLNKGDDYVNTKPAIHIGFLDFTLFPEHPEFYATYKLINVKNHTIYSDKFVLSVVDLKNIELATLEDKKYHIDYWAALFKATTWEDIKMLAAENKYFKEASETLFQLSADDRIREQCEARNAYYARERHHQQVAQELRELQEAQKAYEARERHHQQVAQELKELQEAQKAYEARERHHQQVAQELRELQEAQKAYEARERHHQQVAQELKELQEVQKAYEARERHHQQVAQELRELQEAQKAYEARERHHQNVEQELKELLAAKEVEIACLKLENNNRDSKE